MQIGLCERLVRNSLTLLCTDLAKILIMLYREDNKMDLMADRKPTNDSVFGFEEKFMLVAY